MAEVLGIVASGLAVQQTAGQITKTLFQLRQLLEQIQDAPERIRDLMADLSSFAALLVEMEGQLVEGGPLARQSVQLCRDVLTRLDGVVSSLQIQLASPRRSKAFISALKVVIRRDELKRYEEKLERAFRLLQMSHQCYIAASTKALPDIMAQRIVVEFDRYQQVKLEAIQQVTVSTAVQETPDTENKNQITQRNETRGNQTTQDLLGVRKDIRSRMTNTWSIFGDVFVMQSSSDSSSFQVSLRPPILQRIWNIQATRTYAGWQYVFRQGGPMSAKLLDCIASDDDKGLLRLFEAREGSPHDYCLVGATWSRSVFEEALLNRSIKILTMFFTLGLADDGYIEFITAIKFMVVFSDGSGNLIRLLHRFGCLLNFEELEGVERMKRLGWVVRILDHKPLVAYQQTVFPTYFQLPIRDRLQISRSAVHKVWDGFPGFPQTETFKYLIQPQLCLTESHIIESVGVGYSILGSAAFAFGRASAFEEDASQTRRNTAEWEVLIRDAVGCTMNLLHPIEAYCHGWELTPLLALYIGAAEKRAKLRTSINKVMPAASWSLVRWLRILQSCGVDLCVYGRVEKEILSTNKVTRDVCLDWCPYYYTPYLRLISIDLGPRPEDWRIWWADEYEILAREFWDMVESIEPELPIPGSWVE